jgi:hypothetical protein
MSNENNDTQIEAEPQTLLSTFIELVQRHRGNYEQERVFNRVLGLVLAEVMVFGSHTITQLLLALGLTDADWTAF